MTSTPSPRSERTSACPPVSRSVATGAAYSLSLWETHFASLAARFGSPRRAGLRVRYRPYATITRSFLAGFSPPRGRVNLLGQDHDLGRGLARGRAVLPVDHSWQRPAEQVAAV